MKSILTLILSTFLAIPSFASDSVKKEEKWKAKKAHKVERLTKKIAILQEVKTCFEGAESREAFKQCKATHKEKRKQLKEHKRKYKK